VAVAAKTAAPAPDGERALFDAALGTSSTAQCYARDGFAPGSAVSGPAVITEEETTIILPTSRTATMLPDGCIDIQRKET
jgi:N-methylhydantoinase A